MKTLRAITLVVSCAVAHFAYGWDGVVVGKIGAVDVTGANNYAFRVTLQSSPAMCGNANTWAYLDDADGNYKTYVAAILSAKALGETIHVYTLRNASGYCKIGHLTTIASS